MTRRIQLRGLDPLFFSHPLDLSARQAMEAVPLAPQLLSALSAAISERSMMYEKLGNCLRVGPRQYPDLYRRFVELAGVLDVPRLPHLFVNNDPEVNASAEGMEQYFVTVTGRALDCFSEGELDFILAHELGHIKCDHMKWRSVAGMLKVLGAAGIGVILQQVSGPLAGLLAIGGVAALVGAELAILEWSRKAEFTADRAGLLGCQDIEAAQSALAKLTTGVALFQESIDLDSMVDQAYAFDDGVQQSLVAKLLRLQSLLHQTHPYTPIRVRDIRAWHAAGIPDRIVAGEGRRWEFGESPYLGAGEFGAPPPPPE
jgi:Zn-dependent protease with chaperone function